MEQTGRKKIHYAWFILAGCCILQGASLGLINNCAGVFYSPVCEELGFEMGAFSSYRMIYSVCSALALPFVAAALRKFDVRLVLSAAALVLGVCNIAMGSFHALWQWYVSGVIQGTASAFLCMLPAPILLNNWFHEKNGTAVGISAAFSGLMGMIGSSSLGFMIPACGWRMSYVVIGIASMSCILPVSLFILRYRPEDKGLRAYGARECEGKKTDAPGCGETDGRSARTQGGNAAAARGSLAAADITLGNLMKEPAFYISLAAYACALAASYLNTFLTSCGLAAGLAMTTAAMLTSLSLLANMTTKLFLGRASDSFGVIKIFLFACAVAGFGHLLLFTGSSAQTMAGAFFYGITLPLSSVMMPIFCRRFWTGEVYGKVYSYISMAGTLLASPFNAIFGRLYDMTGTYRLTIAASFLCIAVTAALVAGGGSVNLRTQKAE